jgi:hypothetical protein
MPIKDPEKRKAAHKKYMREVWYPNNQKTHGVRVALNKRQRRDWFAGLKVGKMCATCGEKHPACLDFHHSDPSLKEFSVAEAVSRGLSRDKIIKEMAKCVVLCANCHRKHHGSL